MSLIKIIKNFFFLNIYNNFLLFFSPWNYSVALRKILLKMFFVETRILQYDIALELINNSDNLKKNFFKKANKFANRYLLILYACSILENNNNSDLAEFGVFEGLTLKIFAKNLSKKKCYGFDSFDGLPSAWGNILPKGYFKTKIPTFKQSNIKIIPGLFEETLDKFLENHKKKFSLIHIDCDLYSSTVYVLNKMYPKMKETSYLIMDEFYGYPSYEKYEFKAFFEFVNEMKIDYYILAFSNKSVLIKLIKNK